MKKLILIILAAMLQPAFGQTLLTNTLTGNFSMFNLGARTNVAIVLQISYPLGRTIGTKFISNDPLTVYSDTNGDFQFTNVQWGNYILRPKDSSGTAWYPKVGTNTSGTVALASLCVSSAAVPPNPATNYYTQPQVDALVAAIPTGGTPVAAGFGLTSVFAGTTNVIAIDPNDINTNGTPVSAGFGLTNTVASGTNNLSLDTNQVKLIPAILVVTNGQDSLVLKSNLLIGLNGPYPGVNHIKGVGAFVAGYGTNNGGLQAYADGAMAQGYADDTGTIVALGRGSFSGGYALTSGDITVSGDGSIAYGNNQGTDFAVDGKGGFNFGFADYGNQQIVSKDYSGVIGGNNEINAIRSYAIGVGNKLLNADSSNSIVIGYNNVMPSGSSNLIFFGFGGKGITVNSNGASYASGPLTVGSSNNLSMTLGGTNTVLAVSPLTNTIIGWIPINIGGTNYYIPCAK